MFAGRYVWWLLTATALLLLFLFGFDGLVWFTLLISNCVRTEGSCFTLNSFLMGGVKPVLASVAAGVLVTCILFRIVWLRFLPLWILPVLVWVADVAATLGDYLPLWHGHTDFIALGKLLPPSTFALLAFALFLAFPLEDEDVPVRGQAAPIGILAGFSASICCIYAFVMAAGLPPVLARTLHLTGLADSVLGVQTLLGRFLLVDGGNTIPGLIMVTLFALSLALRIVRHERLMAGEA